MGGNNRFPTAPEMAVAFALALSLTLAGCANAPGTDDDWRAYGRTRLRDRHSPLTQIAAANVRELEVAWRFSAKIDNASPPALVTIRHDGRARDVLTTSSYRHTPQGTG